MNFFATPHKNLLATLFSGLSAFALGCVISVGGDGDAGSKKECGDAFTHSVNQGGTCFCEAGYDWCTQDPEDYTCCKEPGKDQGTCDQPHNVVDGGSCVCEMGWKWCNPDDLNDYSCCESSQGGTGTSGTSTSGGTSSGESETGGTTGAPVCNEAQDPPAACDPATELAFCTHPESCGAEGSKYYICQDGVWVEQTQADQDAVCKLDGWDFSAGCVDTGTQVDLVCGNGPGTACTTGQPDSCGDTDQLLTCVEGKLNALSCLYQCQELGDEMGITYDYGECGEQNGEIQCLCCDEGDPGCPVGGTTGGTTGGTSTPGG